MRFYDLGDCYRVTVSEREVDDWNRYWPCSTLSGKWSFTFDKRNGDLVDCEGKGDGAESVALSHDAQAYARKRLKLPNRFPVPRNS